MKKMISGLIAVMMLLTLASIVSAKREKDETSRDFNVYKIAFEGADNIVQVCTDVKKSHTYYSINAKSTALYAQALEIADALFSSMKGANGYDHFGCATTRV